MENVLSKEDLTNIIKIYKVFDESEISMMIENPDLLTDDNLKLSLINLIDIEDNVLSKMKEYYDKYTFLTGGKGAKFLKKMLKKAIKKKKKSKRKKKKSKRKKKKSKKKKDRDDSNSDDENEKNEEITKSGKKKSSYDGIPNIIINNNNGSQNLEEKTIPQISVPLKFIINSDEKKDGKKKDKKKGGTNIEINKSDGLDILKNSLNSGERDFNLTFDFNKNIDYKNQEFSNFVNSIKNFVKKNALDISNNKNVPEFKNELKQKVNSINDLLPPFYTQDVVLP